MQNLLQQNIEKHITESNKDVYFKNGRGIFIILLFIAIYFDNYFLLQSKNATVAQVLANWGYAAILSAPLLYIMLRFCRYYIPKYFKNSHYKQFWKLICIHLAVLPALTFVLLLLIKYGATIEDARLEMNNGKLLLRTYAYFYLYFLSLTGTLFVIECFENIQLLKKTKSEQQNLNITNDQQGKYDISPAFMNQSLEQIIKLTEIKNDKANAYILQFSNVLRYKLYQINSPRIDIQTSIEALQERIKMHNTISKNTIELNVSGAVANINVPPVFFLEFYEKLITLAEQECAIALESHIWIDSEINIVIELEAIKDIANDLISFEETLARHYSRPNYTFEVNTTNHHYTLQICLQNLAL